MPASVSIRAALVTATLAALYAAAPAPARDVLQEIRQVCGPQTRIVWCEETNGEGRDVMAEGTNLVLMGLDAAVRDGAQPLLRRVGNYHKPLISPKGDRVVFTDSPRAKIYSINWNGTCLRELSSGFAVNVWIDPATAQEWVYAVDVPALTKGSGSPVIRFPLDNPFKRELVWNAGPVDTDNFGLSRDGKTAGTLFPWPKAGVADLQSGTWRQLGRGCWADFSPGAQSLLWVFDGAHRNLLFHTPDGESEWKVSINGAPGLDGFEVYHPRWSNHPRFMTMSGPYKAGKGSNRIRAGGAAVEIYVGRFNRDFTAVEKWVRITENELPDYYPDLWIGPTAPVASDSSATTGGLPAKTVQADARIVVKARLTETTATPSLQAIAPYRQAMVVYAYSLEGIIEGKYPHDKLLVAHWGLVDGKPRPISRTKGESYQMTLEPLDAHRELEGERVMMDMNPGTLPVYYEISR